MLTSIDETPFQTFLISFQHGHKLVGEVILDAERDMTVMRRCANTSAGHADKEDKVWVSFQWRAPDDLDITDEVIIRYVYIMATVIELPSGSITLWSMELYGL